jgi:hypothetical protein
MNATKDDGTMSEHKTSLDRRAFARGHDDIMMLRPLLRALRDLWHVLAKRKTP